MKVLIAVLSSRQPPWGEMINTSKATWDSVEVPGMETIYYVGSPASPLEDRVVGFEVEDDPKTIGQKNLLAFEMMLEREWDYMARVNASCFVHKPRLLEHCKTLPEEGLISGYIIPDPARRPWLVGGSQFVMSRDVVQAIVDNPSRWEHHEPEDIALSHAALDAGFSYTQERVACEIRETDGGWRAFFSDKSDFDFTDWEDVVRLPRPVFFRVNQSPDRDRDAFVMRQLHERFHPYAL